MPGERMLEAVVGCGRGCQPLATFWNPVSLLPGDTCPQARQVMAARGSVGLSSVSLPHSHEPGARQHGVEV